MDVPILFSALFEKFERYFISRKLRNFFLLFLCSKVSSRVIFFGKNRTFRYFPALFGELERNFISGKLQDSFLLFLCSERSFEVFLFGKIYTFQYSLSTLFGNFK